MKTRLYGYLDKLEKDFDIVARVRPYLAVNENDRALVIGECKRNSRKFSLNRLQEKAAKITSHHKGWKTEFADLSLDNMCDCLKDT